MAYIVVTETGPRAFTVDLPEAGTVHDVTVRQSLIEELGLPEDDLGRVVRESFEFLLQREPASAIMREFSLDVIPTYFPEYREVSPRKL